MFKKEIVAGIIELQSQAWVRRHENSIRLFG
jgi:hypothetical protein